MSPEFWVGIVAVFVSGGAIGSVGTLLAQWIVKRLEHPDAGRARLDDREMDLLRSEVGELGRHVRNLDARLDFTEQLLGGALPLAPPPTRLEPPGPGRAEEDE